MHNNKIFSIEVGSNQFFTRLALLQLTEVKGNSLILCLSTIAKCRQYLSST